MPRQRTASNVPWRSRDRSRTSPRIHSTPSIPSASAANRAFARFASRPSIATTCAPRVANSSAYIPSRQARSSTRNWSSGLPARSATTWRTRLSFTSSPDGAGPIVKSPSASRTLWAVHGPCSCSSSAFRDSTSGRSTLVPPGKAPCQRRRPDGRRRRSHRRAGVRGGVPGRAVSDPPHRRHVLLHAGLEPGALGAVEPEPPCRVPEQQRQLVERAKRLDALEPPELGVTCERQAHPARIHTRAHGGEEPLLAPRVALAPDARAHAGHLLAVQPVTQHRRLDDPRLLPGQKQAPPQVLVLGHRHILVAADGAKVREAHERRRVDDQDVHDERLEDEVDAVAEERLECPD